LRRRDSDIVTNQRQTGRTGAGRGGSVLKDFRSFVMRGNVIDLAVGIVIGAAFTAVVQSFVKDLLTPVLSIFGDVNFADYKAQVGGATFAYGNFINAVIAFLLAALVIFFVVIKPIEAYKERRERTAGPKPADKTRPCPECRSEISKEARRCPFCTSEIGVYRPTEA
jgi:large conductance mechanosensitive channel